MAYTGFAITEFIEELGIELKAARNKKGYSLRRVAELATNAGLPIALTTLSRIEAGTRRIDDKMLTLLCNIYEKDPYEIAATACQKHLEHLRSNNKKTQIDYISNDLFLEVIQKNDFSSRDIENMQRYLSLYAEVFKKNNHQKCQDTQTESD